jgi:rhodanese-related sulfurtransferase
LTLEIDISEFAAAHLEGAAVIDVREPYEYVTGHVAGARLIPMGQVPAHLGELPRDERLYVICQSGNRSYTVAAWLCNAGFDAVSVAAGTAGWLRAGHPVIRGMQADESVA